MDLLTKQDLVDNICSAWKQQYYFDGVWNHGYNKEMIYNDLVKLGDNKTAEDITKVIGNDSWVTLNCSECKVEVDSVVIMDSGDYSSYYCKSCLYKALQLIAPKGKRK